MNATAFADTVAVVPALVDSATVAGWLRPLVAKLVFLPVEIQLVVVGFVTSFALDLIEKLLVWLTRLPKVGWAVSWVLKMWGSAPRVVSPLLLFGAGTLATGNWLAGATVAAAGAGIRSMTSQGNKLLNETDRATLKKTVGAMGAVVALGPALVLASVLAGSPAVAAPADGLPPSKLALERFHLAGMAGVQWQHPDEVKFRDSRAVSWAGPRLTYQWSNRVQAQATLRIGLNDVEYISVHDAGKGVAVERRRGRPKELEVAAGFILF